MPLLVKKYLPYDTKHGYGYYECSACKATNDWNSKECQGCGEAITGTDTSIDDEEDSPSIGSWNDDWLGDIP